VETLRAKRGANCGRNLGRKDRWGGKKNHRTPPLNKKDTNVGPRQVVTRQEKKKKEYDHHKRVKTKTTGPKKKLVGVWDLYGGGGLGVRNNLNTWLKKKTPLSGSVRDRWGGKKGQKKGGRKWGGDELKATQTKWKKKMKPPQQKGGKPPSSFGVIWAIGEKNKIREKKDSHKEKKSQKGSPQVKKNKTFGTKCFGGGGGLVFFKGEKKAVW